MGLDMYMKKLNKKVDQKTLVEISPVMDSLRDENEMKELVSDYYEKTLEDFSREYLSYAYVCNFEERKLNEILAKKREDMDFHTRMEIDKISDLTEEEFKEYEKKRIAELYEQVTVASRDLVKYTNEKLELIDKHRELLTDLKSKEIGYWRKHSDLNGVMEDIHYNDRGSSEEFNCFPLVLDKEDIENIIEMHEDHLSGAIKIEHTPGFFWGKTAREDWENSLKDFKSFLTEVDFENETLYYSCWW